MKRMRATLTIAALLLAATGAAAQDYTGSDRDMREVRASELYRLGREQLDQSRWRDAVGTFDQVIDLGGGRADGAYYWKAYALNRDGRASEALAVLARMHESFPDSRWADDARALQLEIRQSAGTPVSPEAEEDEELKLIALNGLLHVDEARAIPLLEKILDGSGSPRMKQQALFVLVQTGSPRARELLMDVARGASNPDLQLAALEQMGMLGEQANLPFLKEVYASTNDRQVRAAIIMSYGLAGAEEELVAVVEHEKDGDLRREAMMHLGVTGGGAVLARLYDRASTSADKGAILDALAMSGQSEKLRQVARSESDLELRKAAIRNLGMTGGDAAGFLLQIYRDAADREVKRSAMDALMMNGAVPELVAIAREESDLDLRKHAVEMLSMMDSPEATEFLLGILAEGDDG